MKTEPSVSELPATELEAIKQRCEKATPGPWTVIHKSAGCTPEDDESCGLGLRIEPDLEGSINRGQFSRAADAQFIARARTDIPKLLTEIERLRKLAELWSKERKELEAKQQRLFDLVRYQRAELHQADLISDDEYTALLADHCSVDRLRSYDALTAELASAKADTARLDWWDRERPLTHNELRTGHIVLAMEDGCSEGRTIRQAIDAAIASGEGKGGK